MADGISGNPECLTDEDSSGQHLYFHLQEIRKYHCGPASQSFATSNDSTHFTIGHWISLSSVPSVLLRGQQRDHEDLLPVSPNVQMKCDEFLHLEGILSPQHWEQKHSTLWLRKDEAIFIWVI